MKTSQEALARMEALLRKMAGCMQHCMYSVHYDEAREIVAMLPEAVDGDLIEARNAVANELRGQRRFIEADSVLDGKYDGDESVRCALACIKRGRELERNK